MTHCWMMRDGEKVQIVKGDKGLCDRLGLWSSPLI